MAKNIYIDSIVEGSSYVIKQITGTTVKTGDVELDLNCFSGNDINVMIGINGNINGQVTFAMCEQLAFKIASLILGQEVDNLADEIGISCLEKLGNMIMGYTAGLFSKNGIMINITPPAIITGEKISIRNDKSNNFSVPVVFDDGQVLRINTALIN